MLKKTKTKWLKNEFILQREIESINMPAGAFFLMNVRHPVQHLR
jgi:hypothetical protein